MKTILNTHSNQLIAKIGLIILLIMAVTVKSYALPANIHRDTSISEEIKVQLGDFKNAGIFNFPHSVSRFYKFHNFQPVWIKPGEDSKRTWEGVLLVNCVLQFGLCHADYHPKEIDYARLHTIFEHPEQVNNNEKARCELMITDALITFINHLHYGKLNPYFTTAKIDAGTDSGFNAGKTLSLALMKPHFMSSVTNVQPKIKAYTVLEEKMRELTQFQQDCDSLPDKQVRQMAINLDRMRWMAVVNNRTWLQVNIPSFKLTVHEAGKDYEFKAIVGNSSTPTPQLNSALTDFTTASRLKMSRSSNVPPGINPRGVIYFWFKNSYGISICGRPETNIFKPTNLALSKGNIKVEKGEKLASLLLTADGHADKVESLRKAINDYVISNFIMEKPIALKITYITCEVQNNVIVYYNDIYSLDKKLEGALYNTTEYLVGSGKL
jgi:murein L,D-transpeptidase YcbB/YkuD